MDDEFWQLARAFIATDTALPRGNTGLEPLVRQALAPLAGGRLTLLPAEHAGARHFNYLASFGPDAPGGLLLVTHLDTVPAGPLERWTTPPHTLHREGGRVRGLGVADVKLDYLCKVFALRALDLGRLRLPVRLLGTFCEEVGLVGARHFAQTHLAHIKPDWVLCGEPSELLPCPAHKGYTAVRVSVPSTGPQQEALVKERKFAGKAAHSSTPHLGDNAILRMLDALDGPVARVSGGSSLNTVPASAEATLADAATGTAASFVDLTPALGILRQAYATWCALATALDPRTAPDFDPATVVNNWGRIGSDGATVWGEFDARLLPEHDPLKLIEAFTATTQLQIDVLRDNPGMRAQATSRLLPALSRVLTAMGRDATPRAKPTSTEAGVFARAGYDAAVTGPGVSVGNAHTANEWNTEADLEAAVELYRRLTLELCG